MDSLLVKLLNYFNLNAEVDDHDTIHEAIERDIIFRGTNLWILIFAIIVASIGLNMNSTAVVIGAMLISPLMGPINGMGYSIATYSFSLFQKSIKNLGFAVLASLVASTVYFAISPVSTAHSELLSRTSPTIYDVLIALFGGLAGIVAISSKQKGNVIPGVAIATALMPPLCTAGYGLASGQFGYFLGAMYLFAINTVFIAISSIAVSRILKFPIRTVVDETRRSRVNRLLGIVIFITIIPSIYFGYLLVQKERFVTNATSFVSNVNFYEGNYLLNSRIEPTDRSIVLVYGGRSFTEDQKARLLEKTSDFGLKNASVKIQQGLSFDSLSQSLNETQGLTAEIQKLSLQLQAQKAVQDSLQSRVQLGRQLLNEIKPRYPQISSCVFSEAVMYRDSLPSGVKTAVVVFGIGEKKLKGSQEDEIKAWLAARLQDTTVQVFYEK